MSISRVQATTPTGVEGTNVGATTSTGNFPSSVTRGNRLVLIARTGTTGGPTDAVSNVTDTLGTHYKRFVSYHGSDPYLEIWDGPAPATGTNAVTVTWSASTLQFVWIIAIELQASSGKQVRRDSHANASGTNAGTSSDIASASISTTGSSVYALLAASQAAFGTFSLNSGMDTLINGAIAPTGVDSFGGLAEKISASAISGLTAHLTASGSAAYSAIHAAWREDVPAVSTYLGATFLGSDESFRLLDSATGTSWTERSSEYWPATAAHSQATRNVAIYYDGTAYWIAHSEATTSDGFVSCPNFSIAKSIDGALFVPFARPAMTGLQRVWGLRWFVDPADSSVHLVFGGSTTNSGTTDFQLYETHPTTPGDFSAWSSPTLITGTAINTGDWFDPQIQRIGSTYYLLAHASDDRPQVHTSSSPFSGYSALRTGDWMADGASYNTATNDAPFLFKLGSTWYFFRDDNGTPLGLIYNSQTAGDWTGGGSTTWAGPTTLGGSPLIRTIDILQTPISGGGTGDVVAVIRNHLRPRIFAPGLTR